MADLYVETESLKQIAAAYSQLVSQLEQLVNNSSADTSEVFPPGIAEQLDDFFSNWNYGVGKVSGLLGNVTQKLNAAASGYEALERSIANAAMPHDRG